MIFTTSSLPTCPLREEKSFSQRAFSIYTDIRKLQDKAKTSYTLSTRRLRFGYAYISEYHQDSSEHALMFYTIHQGEPTQMTPANVDNMLKKYAALAKESDPLFPAHLHAHMFRHSIAMAMYKKGVPLSYIRDFLGHESIDTAEKKFALAGGGTLNCLILTTGGYGAEIQYQGVTVLSNLGNGWGYEMTPAELAKKDEFYSIYWSEYNLVKESGSSELREMPDYLNQDRPSFEARA